MVSVVVDIRASWGVEVDVEAAFNPAEAAQGLADGLWSKPVS